MICDGLVWTQGCLPMQGECFRAMMAASHAQLGRSRRGKVRAGSADNLSCHAQSVLSAGLHLINSLGVLSMPAAVTKAALPTGAGQSPPQCAQH